TCVAWGRPRVTWFAYWCGPQAPTLAFGLLKIELHLPRVPDLPVTRFAFATHLYAPGCCIECRSLFGVEREAGDALAAGLHEFRDAGTGGQGRCVRAFVSAV